MTVSYSFFNTFLFTIMGDLNPSILCIGLDHSLDIYNSGAKFTKHVKTILEQFYDILLTHANVLIHKTSYDNFTTKVLRLFLGVL